MARPTVVTPEVLLKLEQAFAIDCTVEEACSYADISQSTFFLYQQNNPEFSERIAELRQRPVLKARQTVVTALSDPSHAFKYLERKRKKEFGANIEVSGGLTISQVLDELEKDGQETKE